MQDIQVPSACKLDGLIGERLDGDVNADDTEGKGRSALDGQEDKVGAALRRGG